MRLSALFSVVRLDAFGQDSQAKIGLILEALNTYLVYNHADVDATYSSLRAMWMHHPQALLGVMIPGLEGALRNESPTEPVKESFDLLTGFRLDGGDPVFLYSFLQPYLVGAKAGAAPELLSKEFREGVSKLLVDQNILDPGIALDGLRTWIRYCLPQALERGGVIPGTGTMAWAIFESNTQMRATTPMHGAFISYFLDPGIESAELVDMAQMLVVQASKDFSEYDVGGFEGWLRNDYLIDMLVYHPATACCLRNLPTAHIVERISPLISILLASIDAQNQVSTHGILRTQAGLRQALVNAFCLFPDRLNEIGVDAHELAGDRLPAARAISLTPTVSNRLRCSPIDALQVSGCERSLAVRMLARLRERGLSPDGELSAQAALENRVKPVVLLSFISEKAGLQAAEAFYEGVDPASIPDLDHAHIRGVINHLNLPAYSKQSRLNMALIIVHRAIDIHQSRMDRGMKKNNLIFTEFRSPTEIVSDWGSARYEVLKVFEQRGMYSHEMLVWAGFDSTVLKFMSPKAPRQIRDAFMAQDLGL